MRTPSNTRSFSGAEFAKHAKQARTSRLAKTLTDLIDLKVKGIITEAEYRQKKRKLLGF